MFRAVNRVLFDFGTAPLQMVPLFYFIYGTVACGISIALSNAYSKPGSLNAEQPWPFPVIGTRMSRRGGEGV